MQTRLSDFQLSEASGTFWLSHSLYLMNQEYPLLPNRQFCQAPLSVLQVLQASVHCLQSPNDVTISRPRSADIVIASPYEAELGKTRMRILTDWLTDWLTN
jgi:hypothetical protein